jgi:hypothetical protein
MEEFKQCSVLAAPFFSRACRDASESRLDLKDSATGDRETRSFSGERRFAGVSFSGAWVKSQT